MPVEGGVVGQSRRFAFLDARAAIGSYLELASFDRDVKVLMQPAAIEQLNHLIAIDSRHTRCRGMSQRALDLRMFQDVIASRPRDKIHACLKQLSYGYRIAVLPIETN